MTVSNSIDQDHSEIVEAYLRGKVDGRQDALEECAARHCDRIADVLDAIHRHGGDEIEQLRHDVLDAMGHGGAR